jgi:hypothetical protein
VAFVNFRPGVYGFSPLGRNPVFTNRNSATGVPALELGYARSMSSDLEGTLLSVWQQTLVDKKKTVEVGGETYIVRQTAKSK